MDIQTFTVVIAGVGVLIAALNQIFDRRTCTGIVHTSRQTLQGQGKRS